MFDGKSGSLPIIAHPGAIVDSEQFARAAQDVWQVEAVMSKYNEISALFMSANGSTTLQQNILRRALELLQSVGARKNCVIKVINSIVSMIAPKTTPYTQH
ncbi:MAG: hypothetical protein ACKPKO_44325 [Candidatus Fonsibacter sp.]